MEYCSGQESLFQWYAVPNCCCVKRPSYFLITESGAPVFVLYNTILTIIYLL